MREISDLPGIKVGGKTINNLRYADDTVLIATSQKDLQHLLSIINEKSEEVGLKINIKKTFTMTISKQSEAPPCNISLSNQLIQQVDHFKYLGATLTSDGRSSKEIKIRIAQAKTAFTELSSILTSSKITTETRKRVLASYILPIMEYGSEAWTINNETANNINAAEMWFYRRMLKISYQDHVTNEEVLRRIQAKRSLLSNIRSRQARFIGHVLRREKMEHLITTGKIEGKKGRGRPREKLLDGLAKWMSTEPLAVIKKVRSRACWRAMIADAVRHGT
jgi:hypothetical protein